MRLSLHPQNEEELRVRCPFCGFEYVHAGTPEQVPGHDDYQANKAVDAGSFRGDAIRIPMEGECGHKWALIIGFHKGHTILLGGPTRPTDPKRFA